MKSNTQSNQLVGVGELKDFTDNLFPEDSNLAFWIWQILLRDITFFLLAYPGWDIKGCQYQLEVRHVYTGQTREEWAKDIINSDIYNIYDLLNPYMWLISAESLQNEYHKLFVHWPHWRCPDITDHTRWLSVLPDEDAELEVNRLVQGGRYAVREQQVRVHGINPCVYSVLRWWMVTNPRLSQ